ncbi:MAG: DUF350 domain-containing protein [Micavibrio sp.]|nr:DUF350 domain-containing protein [Micavibrio sp.]
MDPIVNMQYVLNAVVFSGIGLIAFAISFVIFDLLTPKVGIWKELVEKQNLAMGIFLGSMFIGMAIIIAAAIHG